MLAHLKNIRFGVKVDFSYCGLLLRKSSKYGNRIGEILILQFEIFGLYNVHPSWSYWLCPLEVGIMSKLGSLVGVTVCNWHRTQNSAALIIDNFSFTAGHNMAFGNLSGSAKKPQSFWRACVCEFLRQKFRICKFFETKCWSLMLFPTFIWWQLLGQMRHRWRKAAVTMFMLNHNFSFHFWKRGNCVWKVVIRKNIVTASASLQLGLVWPKLYRISCWVICSSFM